MTVVVGIVASFVSLYATVPQVLRALRTGSADGVSWSSLVATLATYTLWAGYAFAVADPIQVAANAIALLLMVVLAVAVGRTRTAPGTFLTAAGAVAVASAASWMLLGTTSAFTLAMVATTMSSVRMLPQARLAMSGAPLGGLDPVATLLSWLGMALWLAYGVVVGDAALTLVGVITITMQSTIMVYRLPPRRTLASLAGGRLGPRVARIALPVSVRFPHAEVAGDYELAA